MCVSWGSRGLKFSIKAVKCGNLESVNETLWQSYPSLPRQACVKFNSVSTKAQHTFAKREEMCEESINDWKREWDEAKVRQDVGEKKERKKRAKEINMREVEMTPRRGKTEGRRELGK